MNLGTLGSLPIGIFDFIPIWVLCISIAFTLLISFEVGFQLSKYTTAKNNKDKDRFNSISPMVGGLLAMLAFILAFTFSMAAGQHNLRKQQVLNEANVIGTAYLRTDLVGERDKVKMKELLKEYVDTRVYAIEMSSSDRYDLIMKNAIKRSQEIQQQLWEQVSSASKRDSSPNTWLLIRSINELIDSHQTRITVGLYNRVPSGIWLILLIISSLTFMTMGYHARLSQSRRLAAVIPLIIAFTTLTVVVLDLDRPLEGMITVGQEAMTDLQKSLHKE